jgi:DNA repair photolyase
VVKEIKAKTILIKVKNPNLWFGIDYYINIYRGCMHRCIYCDSRSECYQVNNFDHDIEVKVNAIDLLRKELASKKDKLVIGFGAMSDPYIPIEKEYQLTRKALELLKEFNQGAFILTKSDLVLRDLDLLTDINNRYSAKVAFTITTYDDEVAKKIEPYSPLPSERYKAMRILANAGIEVGIMMSPLLPFILNNEDNIRNIIKQAKENGASFIIPGFGVTLRDRQREYYYQQLDQHYPGLKDKYIKQYGNKYFCQINNIDRIKQLFYLIANEYGLSTDMPTHSTKNSCQQLTIFDII